MFSDLGVLPFLEIIKEYINPVPVIIWGIVGGVAAALVTLIIVVCLRKKCFVRRKYMAHKVLAYLVLFLLPLFVGFCAFQWTALHTAQKQLVRKIPTYLGAGNELFNKYLKAELAELVSDEILASSGNQLLGNVTSEAQTYIAQLMRYELGSETGEQLSTSEKVTKYVVSHLLETDMMKNYLLKNVKGKISEFAGIDPKLVDTLFDTEIQNILDSGVLNTVFEHYIREGFGKLKGMVWLMFFAGLLVPVAEIVISNILEKRRQRSDS